ncbi:uncharacterized protein [Haliotis cracherodii]|uniref:uncharacterized protein n=1 Tax=Haliotis cracherodii TaxID=6455 RepID=UPI0039EA29E5
MHLKVIILVLYLWANSELGTSELICPSQSEVGCTADITCIAPDTIDKHGYSTPNKEVAAICQTNLSSCQPLGDYSAAVINDTCSVLTIPSVKLSDAGDWRCTVSPSPMLTCHMVVYKLPSCLVISDEDHQSTRVNLTGFLFPERVQIQVVMESSVCEGVAGPVKEITDGSFICVNTQCASADETNVTFRFGTVLRSVKCEVKYTLTDILPSKDTTTTTSPGKRERHTSTGIAIPVIIFIVILIVIVTTIVMLYRNRHALHCIENRPTRSSTDSSYKVVDKSKPISL